MKRSLSFILACLLVFALGCGVFAADETADYLARSSGKADIKEYAASLGYGDEWSIFALARFDVSFESYERSIDENREKLISPVERERCALALAICGGNAEKITSIAEGAAGSQGIMSVIFGLHLCANGAEFADAGAEKLVNDLISMQLSDGGFALFGSVSDVDVSAMALQALAEFRAFDGVESTIEKVISFLSSAQKDNGGFISFGNESSESISMVIIALSSLGIDCKTDTRFIKNGKTLFDALGAFKLSDGSLEHVAGGGVNRIATVQALCAAESYKILGKPFWVFEKEDPAEESSESTEEESDTESSIEEASEETSAPEGSSEETAEESVVSGAVSEQSESSKEEPSQEEISAGESAPEESAPQNKNGGKRIKQIILLALALLALGALCALIIMHKANVINICVIVCLFALLAAVVLFVDIVSPIDYYGRAESKTDAAGTAYMSIRAFGIEDKDIILEKTAFEFEENATVYDMLVDAARIYSIPLDVSGTGAFVYVRAIERIYERAHGDLSGWVYTVNGVSANVGCGSYYLKDGDVVEWLYTTDGIDRTGTYENP